MKTQKQGEKSRLSLIVGINNGTQVDKNDYLMFILSKDSFFSLTTYWHVTLSEVGSFKLDGKKLRL
jgi:hypothetical protein